MRHIKDHKTERLFDSWDFLGPKRRKLLNLSWAGTFREYLFHELPVESLSGHYSQDQGRPSKELYTLMGTVLLQQAFDLTDEQTIQRLAFDIQWHYALDISEESDQSKYLSLKTLWTVRTLMAEKGMDSAVFAAVTAKLNQAFGVDGSKQRLDSVHVRSNMRRLGKIGVLVESIRKFLKHLKGNVKQLFQELPEAFVEKYLRRGSGSCFSLVKPSESEKTLQSVAEDVYYLLELFSSRAEVLRMSSYRLLQRVFSERCSVRVSEESDAAVQVEVKPVTEISADCLQSPHDPEAGYDGHKGQGYKVQVQETYVEGDSGSKAAQPQLIQHVQVSSASEHDVNALVPALEAVREGGMCPVEVLADSHYGSDENCEAARVQGVEVVSPVIGSGRLDEERLALSEFKFSEERGDLELQSCPGGQAPLEVKKNERRYSAVFDNRRCGACPFGARCPGEHSGGVRRYVRYSAKEVRLSLRRAYERTEEFRERYRWRAGVEGTMSELDRVTGLKHLRVRGLQGVRFCATLKACAVNIFRATRARKTRICGKVGHFCCEFLVFGHIIEVPERFGVALGLVGSIFARRLRIFTPHAENHLHNPATAG